MSEKWQVNHVPESMLFDSSDDAFRAVPGDGVAMMASVIYLHRLKEKLRQEQERTQKLVEVLEMITTNCEYADLDKDYFVMNGLLLDRAIAALEEYRKGAE